MNVLRATAALLISTLAAVAQTNPRPEFEVASIKPVAPRRARSFVVPIDKGVNINNVSLKELMLLSYRIQPFQISGGPGWIESLSFDISAKAEAVPNPADVPLMIQSLLEERFQLKLRREIKEMPIYALVMARKDRKLGPRLVEAAATCETPSIFKAQPPREPGKPWLQCGEMTVIPSRLNAREIAMSKVVPVLSRLLGRSVIDQTGLTSTYDIQMEWTPDESQTLQLPPEAPRPAATGPSLFTALQEQLGLKLESQKGPVEMFIIDAVEKPSEN